MGSSKTAFVTSPAHFLESIRVEDIVASINRKGTSGNVPLSPQLRKELLALGALEYNRLRDAVLFERRVILMLQPPSEKSGPTKPPSPLSFGRSFYRVVAKELHKALCTNSSAYKKHIGHVSGSVHALVMMLATKLAQVLGISGPLLSAAIYAVLMLMAKMGKNIWCQYMKLKLQP